MKGDGMKKMTIVLALGACTHFARDAQFTDAPYMNPRLSTEERMNDLIESLEASYLSENLAEFQKHCRLISELTKELISNEKISLKSIC